MVFQKVNLNKYLHYGTSETEEYVYMYVCVYIYI
jgi:hypothetical protein